MSKPPERTLTERDFPPHLHGPFRPAITGRRCPKCRGTSFELTEHLVASTSWEVRDGLLNLQAGIHEIGFAYRLEATCSSCGHQWRIPKAIQITDVAQELDPTTFAPIEQ